MGQGLGILFAILLILFGVAFISFGASDAINANTNQVVTVRADSIDRQLNEIGDNVEQIKWGQLLTAQGDRSGPIVIMPVTK